MQNSVLHVVTTLLASDVPFYCIAHLHTFYFLGNIINVIMFQCRQQGSLLSASAPLPSSLTLDRQPPQVIQAQLREQFEAVPQDGGVWEELLMGSLARA